MNIPILESLEMDSLSLVSLLLSLPHRLFAGFAFDLAGRGL